MAEAFSIVPDGSALQRPKRLNRNVGAKYLKTKVQVADRLELLLITYEEVIKAAENKDTEKIVKAVNLLINSLDLDHATEFGIGMLRLYKFSIAEAQKGDYQAVIGVFLQLRDAWRVLQDSMRKEKKNG